MRGGGVSIGSDSTFRACDSKCVNNTKEKPKKLMHYKQGALRADRMMIDTGIIATSI